MTNLTILTSAFGKYDYIGLALFLVPIVFSIFMAKRYNTLHGIICFILTSYLVIYVFSFFDDFSGFGDIMMHLVSPSYLHLIVADLLSKIPAIGEHFALDAKYSEHLVLGVYAIIFIISQVISQICRNSRY